MGKQSACNAGDAGSIPGSGRPPWRKAWQPLPVYLPGEPLGQRSLVGHSPWGLKELEMMETTEHSCTHMSSLWHELRDNSAQKINTSKCDCDSCDSLDYL